MDDKEAIAAAKKYVNDIYAEEQVTNVALEEIEHWPEGNWVITVAFSRPWNTPRTRAQEVLENLGAVSPMKRSYKIITMANDGKVISMKNREKTEAV
jgi:hypothetical protein